MDEDEVKISLDKIQKIFHHQNEVTKHCLSKCNTLSDTQDLELNSSQKECLSNCGINYWKQLESYGLYQIRVTGAKSKHMT